MGQADPEPEDQDPAEVRLLPAAVIVAVAALLALLVHPRPVPQPAGVVPLGPLLTPHPTRGALRVQVRGAIPETIRVQDPQVLPAVSVEFPAGARVTRAGRPVPEVVFAGVLPDELPVPLAAGRHLRMGIRVEPSEARFEPPVQVSLPNLDRLPPGARATWRTLAPDPDGRGWAWTRAGELVVGPSGERLVGGPVAAGGLYALEAAPSLSPRAWRLFLIFMAAITMVILEVMPIVVASIGALAVAVLSGCLSPATAFSGFSEGFILLIAVAFLIARGVVKSGLGQRIAYVLISRLGQTTLGLGYSLVLTDMIIAPAFPSNTARSGVLFPIAESLARGTDSLPDEATRRRSGAFLMMMGMTGLSISSGLWLTAMAANPSGAAIAAGSGVAITFNSWLLAASLPSLVALVVVPRVLYRAFPPEVTRTPEAPALARQRLEEMGPPSLQEKIMGATFLGLVVLWALSGALGIDKTAVAFGGLFVVMASGIFTVRDLEHEGGTLEVLLWFAILYSLSTALHQLGFMTWLGSLVAGLVVGYPWPLAYAALLTAYVGLHYFFVSQSAQMLALFPVFLAVSITAGVPPAVMAYLLLFATNFFSVLTPQASSANAIFLGSGYVSSAEVYRYGGLVTLANLLVYGLVGPPWILFLAGWL